MKDKRLAYMPFYPNDFLSATTHWEPSQRGMYITLLSHEWNHGELPLSEKVLMRVSGYTDRKQFSDDWAVVGGKFIQHGDGYINIKLEDVRQDALEKHDKAVEKAKKAAAARWASKNA